MNGTELVEGVLGFHRQQLVENAGYRVQRQAFGGKVHLFGGRHDVRLLADMKNHRLAIEPNDCLEQ